MLGRLMALPLRLKTRPEDAAEAPAVGSPGPEAMTFPPMRPLRPPQARNDDVLEPIQAAVEEALREAGYLK